jgi:hypothetical protein
MKYWVVFGDEPRGRGVVELEAKSYSLTAEGALIVKGEEDQPIATWAPGAWRSIVDSAAFKASLTSGAPSEDSRRRQAQRPLQAF